MGVHEWTESGSPLPSPQRGADTWLQAFKTQPVCLGKKQKQVWLQGAGSWDVCWENVHVGKSSVNFLLEMLAV